MGQGDFEIEYPPLHDLAVSENPVLRAMHDQLTYIDPAAAPRDLPQAVPHGADVASSARRCHKVHLDVPVNNYRWFRGFNDYDNWQASGVSGKGARSFYYPPKPQKCADCHMPLVAVERSGRAEWQVRSHRFAAANTALPFVNDDTAQLKAVQDFLRDGADLGGRLRPRARRTAPARGPRAPRPRSEPRLASTFAVGEESMNFGAAQNFVRPRRRT